MNKNLENLSEEVKLLRKNMKKHGCFSFDYRSEYNAKKKKLMI